MAGGFISREEAHTMIERFQNNESVVVNTPYGFLYDYSLIQQLIEQNPGASGVRVYAGLDEDNKLQTVLVATDAEGNNMFGGALPCLDQGECCPPDCSTNPV